MLTIYGWISAVAIALLILFSGLHEYIIYPISFLLFGSLISKLNPDNGDNEGRSARQVIANAGVSAIIGFVYFFTQYDVCRDLFVLSWSVAMSDTFSSEIGKRYGGKPIDILTFSTITKGLSGGISLIGSIGGFIGGLVIAATYYIHACSFETSLNILTFGFLGMIIDSIIGSTLQAKYQIDGIIREYGLKSNLTSGYRFIDNCMTNFISIAVTVMLFMIYSLVL